MTTKKLLACLLVASPASAISFNFIVYALTGITVLPDASALMNHARVVVLVSSYSLSAIIYFNWR